MEISKLTQQYFFQFHDKKHNETRNIEIDKMLDSNFFHQPTLPDTFDIRFIPRFFLGKSFLKLSLQRIVSTTRNNVKNDANSGN